MSCPESSATDAVSSTATGLLLVGATTVTNREPVSVKKSLDPAVVPSSVTVYEIVVIPVTSVLGVNVIFDPSVVTVPDVSPDTIDGPLIVRESFSMSVSSLTTSIAVAVFATIATTLSTATGASFTALTVIVRVAVSVRNAFDPPVVPSSVMV